MTYHATNKNNKKIIIASIHGILQFTLSAFRQGIGLAKETPETTPL
jgi:hypothetical protein